MSTYVVHVIIENKPNISDPEGDTILNDLVLKSKNSSIKKIRAGKILKFTIEATDKKMVGKVVDVIETGYSLGEKILRYPKVVVAN